MEDCLQNRCKKCNVKPLTHINICEYGAKLTHVVELVKGEDEVRYLI